MNVIVDVVTAVLALLSLPASVWLGSGLARRVTGVAGVALCSVVVTGGVAAVVPGDPVAAALGEDAPDDARAAVREELGLHDRDTLPAAVRALAAGGHLVVAGVRGVIGLDDGPRSIRTREPVRALLLARLPRTVGLGTAAVALGVSVGVLAALVVIAGGIVSSSLARILVALAAATPRFVLGPLLVLSLAVAARVLPTGGVDDGVRSWVMPVLTLALPFAGVVARVVVVALREAMAAPFARTARMKGVDDVAIVVRHALPHALLAIVQLGALQWGALLGGAVIVERVFSWPGLGSLLQEALRRGDLPVVQGVVVVGAVGIALTGLMGELLGAVVDPRLRRRA